MRGFIAGTPANVGRAPPLLNLAGRMARAQVALRSVQGSSDPAAAAVLHSLIIRVLSDRLAFANREIAALV